MKFLLGILDLFVVALFLFGLDEVTGPSLNEKQIFYQLNGIKFEVE